MSKTLPGTLRSSVVTGAALVVVATTSVVAFEAKPAALPVFPVVAEVELTALSDISTQGAYNAWVYSYGSANPSVCSLGGAPLCQNFGSPTYPTGAQGLLYYLVDNALNNQGSGSLLDVYFQFGLPATIYSALYDLELGKVADGLFLAPALLQQAFVDLTEDIAVIGPLIKAYSLGIWDVYNADGELVSVEHGLFGLRALGGYALDFIRGSSPLSTLFPKPSRLVTPASAVGAELPNRDTAGGVVAVAPGSADGQRVALLAEDGPLVAVGADAEESAPAMAGIEPANPARLAAAESVAVAESAEISGPEVALAAGPGELEAPMAAESVQTSGPEVTLAAGSGEAEASVGESAETSGPGVAETFGPEVALAAGPGDAEAPVAESVQTSGPEVTLPASSEAEAPLVNRTTGPDRESGPDRLARRVADATTGSTGRVTAEASRGVTGRG